MIFSECGGAHILVRRLFILPLKVNPPSLVGKVSELELQQRTQVAPANMI